MSKSKKSKTFRQVPRVVHVPTVEERLYQARAQIALILSALCVNADETGLTSGELAGAAFEATTRVENELRAIKSALTAAIMNAPAPEAGVR